MHSQQQLLPVHHSLHVQGRKEKELGEPGQRLQVLGSCYRVGEEAFIGPQGHYGHAGQLK